MAHHTFVRPVLTARLVIASLWVLLGMLLTNAAHADLAITGGTVAQQQQLRQVFAELPACCHTSCSVCVRLLNKGDMDACLQASAAAHAQRLVNADAVDGFYQNSSKAITLRAPFPTADVSAIFTHEYGHYVWTNVLTPVQRDQYRKIYDAQRSARHLVSQYASVSVDEGFAEAFAFYVRDRPVLERCDAGSCGYLANTLDAARPAPSGAELQRR